MKQFFLFFFSIPFFLYTQNGLLEEWKNKKHLSGASYGYCVMDAESSKVLSEYNAHLALVPASTLKIFCTSAALSILGNDYQFKTSIYTNGTFDKSTGVIDGDIIIVGSGDPSLQSRYFSKESITQKWAAILKEKGVKEIKGGVIGDGSFIKRTIPGTWLWEDVSNYYGAAPCGLNFRDNEFEITFTTKTKGTEAILQKTFPNYISNPYQLKTFVTANGSEDNAFVYGDPFSFSRNIQGTLPPNKINYGISAALPDPALLCAEELFLALKAIGISCDEKKIRSNYEVESNRNNLKLLHAHFSPKLSQLVYYTNQHSNNLYCESILRALGNGDHEKGIQAVKYFCLKHQLDTTALYMKDACGLSRVNSNSTFLQASLLTKIYSDSILYASFNRSLPFAGKEGSMRNIGKGTFIENNLRAKTGYLQRARGYCGYVRTKTGKNIAFSVLLSNYNCSASEAKRELEKFLVGLGDL